jgi:hypothetical protein
MISGLYCSSHSLFHLLTLSRPHNFFLWFLSSNQIHQLATTSSSCFAAPPSKNSTVHTNQPLIKHNSYSLQNSSPSTHRTITKNHTHTTTQIRKNEIKKKKEEQNRKKKQVNIFFWFFFYIVFDLLCICLLILGLGLY